MNRDELDELLDYCKRQHNIYVEIEEKADSLIVRNIMGDKTTKLIKLIKKERNCWSARFRKTQDMINEMSYVNRDKEALLK